MGKWHLGFSWETSPNAQGFDSFFGHHSGCIDFYSHTFYWHGNEPHHHDLYRNREEVHEEGQYMTHLITREATAFIDAHRNEPFLLYVPFNAPHYPMHAPTEYVDAYADLPRERRLYAAMVTAMDESIGAIVDRLDKHQLRDDTMELFMSDNGPTPAARANGWGGSSGPFRDHKFSLFEGGIRMPAILSWPGRVPLNETRGQLTIAMDVFATVADAIQATLPEGRTIDGRSWLPFLENNAAPGHETLYWSWAAQDAVRQGKWKLVHNGIITLGMSKQRRADGPNKTFLANLDADPGEEINLAERHPEVVKQLLALRDDWKAFVNSAD